MLWIGIVLIPIRIWVRVSKLMPILLRIRSGIKMNERMNEWTNLLLSFLALGPTVYARGKKINTTRIDIFNRASLPVIICIFVLPPLPTPCGKDMSRIRYSSVPYPGFYSPTPSPPPPFLSRPPCTLSTISYATITIPLSLNHRLFPYFSRFFHSYPDPVPFLIAEFLPLNHSAIIFTCTPHPVPFYTTTLFIRPTLGVLTVTSHPSHPIKMMPILIRILSQVSYGTCWKNPIFFTLVRVFPIYNVLSFSSMSKMS